MKKLYINRKEKNNKNLKEKKSSRDGDLSYLKKWNLFPKVIICLKMKK